VAIFAMEQQHRDRLRNLWEAGSKSVQKLIKMTGLDQSTIYKNIKKLKGDKGVEGVRRTRG
jgi:DNA-binding MarR family transcriptional regulator